MTYQTQIKALKHEEHVSNPDARFLLSQIYSECCAGAIARSRVYSFDTREEAINEATNLIGDYDLSTTEYWQDSFLDIEKGDPALDAAIAALEKNRRITLGDFTIEIEVLP